MSDLGNYPTPFRDSSIQDLAQLRLLHRQAIRSESLEEFQRSGERMETNTISTSKYDYVRIKQSILDIL